MWEVHTPDAHTEIWKDKGPAEQSSNPSSEETEQPSQEKPTAPKKKVAKKKASKKKKIAG